MTFPEGVLTFRGDRVHPGPIVPRQEVVSQHVRVVVFSIEVRVGFVVVSPQQRGVDIDVGPFKRLVVFGCLISELTPLGVAMDSDDDIGPGHIDTIGPRADGELHEHPRKWAPIRVQSNIVTGSAGNIGR